MPSATATSELASEFRVSLMRLGRRLRLERPDEGPTPTQLAVLGTLERHGPMTLGELASHEKVQPPSMTRTTATLVERGLLTRVTAPADRRQVQIAISDAGLALLREDRKRRDAWLAGHFDKLTSDERALLHQVAPLLDRLAQS
ncbi:MAG TPA: MarR family transcriptional regulator [Acidothermaceae bacterium]|nr:MarR family transcriptional regulator [Acidothermaceae bacterium]